LWLVNCFVGLLQETTTDDDGDDDEDDDDDNDDDKPIPLISAKTTDELTTLLRRLAKKINTDQQYSKNVRTATVYLYMYSFRTSNNLLNPLQSAYFKHSTETALLHIYNHLMLSPPCKDHIRLT